MRLLAGDIKSRWSWGGPRYQKKALHSSPSIRTGSFDTDAFGVLLRMTIVVYQELRSRFMLSSQS